MDNLLEKFTEFIKKKTDGKIDVLLWDYPRRLLQLAINELHLVTIDGQPLFDTLSEYQILCYVYQQWKQDYYIKKKSLVESERSGTNLAFENFEHLLDQSPKFESLFLAIDNLQIFEQQD